jgi:DNA transposition AAA+ family ATPase
MRDSFVNTDNHRRFEEAVAALTRRGAQEARFLVVDGLPGLGKTTILDRYATQHEAAFLTAKPGWTAQWLMEDLIATLGMASQGSLRKNTLKVTEELTSRQLHENRQGLNFLVFIDEADSFSRSTQVVESIRALADMSGACFVLIGMGKLKDNLVRFPQVTSRVTKYCHFEPASSRDVREFINQVCETKVSDDLCDYIRKVTGGFNREIKEAIANIERFAKKSPHEVMSCDTMDGQLLVNDRKNGRAIIVLSALNQEGKESVQEVDTVETPRFRRGGKNA